MFRIQTAFERLAVEYFNNNGFIEIHTPKITALSSEGGSEVFELKNYFGQKAYLTQSPQLYKQMSMMAGFDKTFEIGEYFRANPQLYLPSRHRIYGHRRGNFVYRFAPRRYGRRRSVARICD